MDIVLDVLNLLERKDEALAAVVRRSYMSADAIRVRSSATCELTHEDRNTVFAVLVQRVVGVGETRHIGHGSDRVALMESA